MARFEDRNRNDRDRRDPRYDRYDNRAPLRTDFRRDFRPDDRPVSRQDQRGPPRADSRLDESRDLVPPAPGRPDSSVTLEELQTTMKAMQSLMDKQARQARQNQESSPPRRLQPRAAYTAHVADSDEIAYTAFITDYADDSPSYSTAPRPLHVRSTIDSD